MTKNVIFGPFYPNLLKILTCYANSDDGSNSYSVQKIFGVCTYSILERKSNFLLNCVIYTLREKGNLFTRD